MNPEQETAWMQYVLSVAILVDPQYVGAFVPGWLTRRAGDPVPQEREDILSRVENTYTCHVRRRRVQA